MVGLTVLGDPSDTAVDGVYEGYDIDLAYGSDENDFSLSLPVRLPQGTLVGFEGTGYGGIIDELQSKDGELLYKGRAWTGILADKVLSPDSGQDYLTYSGTLAGGVGMVLKRIGLETLFQTAADAPTVQVSYQFPRYCTAYAGLCGMLADGGSAAYVPVLSFQHGKVLVSARLRQRYGAESNDAAALTVVESKPVNHLVCLGKGDLRNRTVIHLYADGKGNVSRTQSLFGADEIAQTYDYSSAESAELLKEGAKKLAELQTASSVSMTVSGVLPDDAEPGDLLDATDWNLNVTSVSAIGKKIVKGSGGTLEVSYECGKQTASASASVASSGETVGGSSSAAEYSAGDGISISGHTISATVTQTQIDAVAKTANDAAAIASNLSAAIGAAQSAASAAQSAADAAKSEADAAVQTVTGVGPVNATRSGNSVKLTIDTASSSSRGAMSSAMCAKLNGIEAGANKYELPAATVSSLGGVKPDGTTVLVQSDGTISAAILNDAAASFLAAYPVGAIYQSSKPDEPGRYGGSWVELPSLGGFLWQRVK